MSRSRLSGELLWRLGGLVMAEWTVVVGKPAAGVFRRPDVHYREVSQF